MVLTNRIMTSHRPGVKLKRDWLGELWNRISVSRKDLRQLEFELPDFARALGLLLGNGLPVNVALGWLAPRAQGLLAAGFESINQDLELGADLVEKLSELAQLLPSTQLIELCEKLSVSLTRGAPISHQVMAHAAACRSNLQRRLLRQAGSNETKMLLPVIFLILPVTVLFAIFPSMLLLGSEL